jgi:hypothetical protein
MINNVNGRVNKQKNHWIVNGQVNKQENDWVKVPGKFTHSKGQVSMINNVNGQVNKQEIDWDGNVENLGKNKANLELHTNWNGTKNNLNLHNAQLATLSQNPKFKAFVGRMTKLRGAPGFPQQPMMATTKNFRRRSFPNFRKRQTFRRRRTQRKW